MTVWLQADFEWTLVTSLQNEDHVNELLDLKLRWSVTLKNKLTRKWVLKDRIKNGDERTKTEALALFLCLYEEEELSE